MRLVRTITLLLEVRVHDAPAKFTVPGHCWEVKPLPCWGGNPASVPRPPLGTRRKTSTEDQGCHFIIRVDSLGLQPPSTRQYIPERG